MPSIFNLLLDYDELVDLLNQYSSLLVSIGAAAGVSIVAHKKVIKPTYLKIKRRITGWFAMVNSMDALISAQLKTNGGGSLIDKVDQIAPLQKQVALISRKVDEAAVKIDANYEADEVHFKTIHVNAQAMRTELGGQLDALRLSVQMRYDENSSQLNRQKALIYAVINQLPEPQRTAIMAIVETVEGDPPHATTQIDQPQTRS